GLAEEDLPCFLVEGAVPAEVRADGAALLHGGPARNGIPPAPDMGEIRKELPTLELAEDPGPGGHVGDRVFAGQIRRVRQPPLEDTEKTVRLVAEPLDGVGNLLRRVAREVVQLSGDGAEVGDLPGDPLQHLVPAADVTRQETAGLLGEV